MAAPTAITTTDVHSSLLSAKNLLLVEDVDLEVETFGTRFTAWPSNHMVIQTLELPAHIQLLYYAIASLSAYPCACPRTTCHNCRHCLSALLLFDSDLEIWWDANLCSLHTLLPTELEALFLQILASSIFFTASCRTFFTLETSYNRFLSNNSVQQ
eukprot:Gb_01716 [translate_table: standard]